MFFTSRRELIGRTSRRKRIPGNHTDWTQYDYRELFGGSWGEKIEQTFFPTNLGYSVAKTGTSYEAGIHAMEIPLILTELNDNNWYVWLTNPQVFPRWSTATILFTQLWTMSWVSWCDVTITRCSDWGHFSNAYELGALQFSLLNRLNNFQYTGKIFYMEFQRIHLKFQTKYYKN